MGRVIDLIYDAFVAIQSDGSLILDYDFMMGIFADLQKEMPEFNTYMAWFLKEKELLDHQASLSVSSQWTKEQKCSSIPQKSRICKQMNYA